MPSTYSPNLRIELIANGEQSGTWGTTTNSNLGTLIEDAISGYVSVSVTSANQALTAINGAVDQSRNMVVNLTTTTSAAFNVYIPPVEKFYVIRNASAYDATIFCSTVLGNTTAAGTGVTVLAGTTTMLFSDGTNVSAALTSFSGNLVVSTNSTSPALRVTQVGSGDAILVEDSANPDSTPFVVTSTGDVGIGKTTPTVKLDVVGTINASTGFNGTVGATTPAAGTFTSLSDSGNLTFTGTGNRIIGDFSNATLANRVMFQTSTTNGLTLLRAIPNGTATQSNIAAANNSDPANCGVMQIAATAGEAQLSSFINGTGTYLPMTFYTGGSERMRVDTSGNVGIGTSSPAGKLDIYDASSSIASVLGDGTARLVTSRASTNTSAPEFQMYKYRGTLASPTIVASGDATGRLQFFGYDGAALRATAEIRSEVDATPGASDMPGRLVFYTTADGAASVSERMRIDSSGNVGIGTSSPAYKLDVAGAISTNNNLTFTGTGNRITGDFSNATVANRVMFQTSTVNGNTNIHAITNGTGSVSSVQANNSSDPANGSQIYIAAGASVTQIAADKSGTGTYLPMTFYTGGSERMRVDTSGNVGIGTSSPGARLGVAGDMRILANAGTITHAFNYNENGGEIILCDETGAGSTLFDQAGNSTRLLELVNGSELQVGLGGANTTGVIKFMRAGYVEAARIDSSGNVGIGTSSPGGYRLNVNGSYLCSSGVDLTPGAAFGTQFNINGNGYTGGIALDLTGMWIGQNSGSRSLIFACGNNGSTVTERARIDGSGRLLVGTTSSFASTAFIQVNTYQNGAAAVGFATKPSTNANYDAADFYNSSGSLVGYISCTSSATSYVTSSDYRLKENVQPMTGALAKVAALKPCAYTWKADGSNGQGFIAHELAEVVPDAVTGEKDAVNEDGSIKPQGIDTSFLVATLTAAIQEQQSMIEELKAKVAALEEK